MPNCALNFSLTVPRSKSAGAPTLNLLGGSVNTLGSINRSIARVEAAVAAANEAQATQKGDSRTASDAARKLRRVAGAAVFLATGGAGLAGIGGATGLVAGAAAATAV